MKKFMSGFGLFLCAVLFLPLCGCEKRPVKYSYTDMTVFDTQTVIVGWDTDKTSFDEKAEAAMQELTRLHRLYDIYNTYDGINNLKTVNDNAGKTAVEVDGDIIGMLEYCVAAYEATNGAVNAAMGSVTRLWHDRRVQGAENEDSARIPDAEVLKEAASHTDFSCVTIDKEAGTVYISDPQTSLDVGAVAKGYATELCARFIESRGWDNMALNVGGNVRTVGLREDGQPWVTGVENPVEDTNGASGNAYFCRINLYGGEALVTSGSYQRYFVVNGVRYHHIIDPETLMPENRYLSVSVLCTDSGMGDALSTALFNMSEEDGRGVLEAMGFDAAWVYPDGTVSYTGGFEERLLP